jgi:hypothetical protein
MSDDPERDARLLAAMEAQTNAINRLVQVLENKQQRAGLRASRQRRDVERTGVVNDRVKAAANSAVARVRARG